MTKAKSRRGPPPPPGGPQGAPATRAPAGGGGGDPRKGCGGARVGLEEIGAAPGHLEKLRGRQSRIARQLLAQPGQEGIEPRGPPLGLTGHHLGALPPRPPTPPPPLAGAPGG